MSGGEDQNEAAALDVGAYCRRVERHLTRVNGGHLIRIVGPAFDLVRRWAESGVPLSVVFRGIDQKAERHRHGAARRPLRLEFCEDDVTDVFESWRRATGRGTEPFSTENGDLGTEHAHANPASVADAAAGLAAAEPETAPGSGRRLSLTKHLDRAAERLRASLGRLDLPEAFRDQLAPHLAAVSALRERAKTSRGKDRDAIVEALAPIDRDLIAAARAAADPGVLAAVTREAEQDLAAYRGRLTNEQWQRAIDHALRERLRARFGLPTLLP